MKTPEGFFSVKIQTKPYLKKYLHSLYGYPLIITTHNSFGVVVNSLITRPLEYQKDESILRQRFDVYPDPLEFFVSKRYLIKRKGYDFTDERSILLNKFFEVQFSEHLVSWCEMGAIYKVEYKKNIEEFCWRHKIEIDEDVTLEALQKKERRCRNKKKNGAIAVM